MRPIILDTQLMVLLAVGITSTGIILKHKNLTAYTRDDFDLLVSVLGEDPKLVLLPNTVSEAANLLRQHRNPERRAILETFRHIIERHEERYVASVSAARAAEYHRLGIADSAILECETPATNILTADAELYVAAASRGLIVTNFNHLREADGIL